MIKFKSFVKQKSSDDTNDGFDNVSKFAGFVKYLQVSNVKHIQGRHGRKTAKTKVLPGFCEIERGPDISELYFLDHHFMITIVEFQITKKMGT